MSGLLPMILKDAARQAVCDLVRLHESALMSATIGSCIRAAPGYSSAFIDLGDAIDEATVGATIAACEVERP